MYEWGCWDFFWNAYKKCILCAFPEKPSPPVGPVILSDIQKTSLVLAWKPSKNDGRSPLTAYYIEMRDPKNGSWSAVTRVTPDITSYCFQTLKTEKEYFFRVIAENSVGKSEPLTSDGVIPRSPYSMLYLIIIIVSIFSLWKSVFELFFICISPREVFKTLRVSASSLS